MDVMRGILRRMLMGMTVVVVCILAVPLCLCLAMLMAVWSAAEAAIGFLE